VSRDHATARPNADFEPRLRRCSRIGSAGGQAPTARPVSHRCVVLLNNLETQIRASRDRSFSISARGERRRHRRGAIRLIRVIAASLFPSSVGRALSGRHLRPKGCSDAWGSGGSARIASGTRETAYAMSRDCCSTASSSAIEITIRTSDEPVCAGPDDDLSALHHGATRANHHQRAVRARAWP